MAKNKKQNYQTEDENEIIRFFIILAVVVIITLGFYLFTKNVVKKVNVNRPDAVTQGSIDYSTVTVGTMLGKPDSEYYVMVYDNEDTLAPTYKYVVNVYEEDEEKLPVYFIDLGNALNKKYVSKDGNGNASAKKINELSFGKVTLIKVENGKIANYFDGIEAIKEELNYEENSQ